MHGSYGMSEASAIWSGISAIIAIIGGFVLYFTFLSKKNEGKFKGFLNWLQDFLTFKKMFIEHFLRITYLILAIFITLASLGAGHILATLLVLVVGNLVLRMAYEFSLILLVICRNTTEMNKKMSCECKEEKKEDQ